MSLRDEVKDIVMKAICIHQSEDIATDAIIKLVEGVVPELKPERSICTWLNSGRESDIYIDGFNTCCRYILKNIKGE